MHALLLLVCLLLPAQAAAQNLSASSVRLVPGTPAACPTGRVCVVGTSAASPNRVAFQDSDGGILTAGDAKRLVQSAGSPVGPAAGDIWFDTTANQPMCRISGSSVPMLTPQEKAFTRVCTLTSAAAATPVVCLTDADVGAGKKAYVTGVQIVVNGAVGWGLVTTVTLEDTSGVDLLTIPVASLTSNALLYNSNTSATTSAAALLLGSGTTTAKGLRVLADMNGTGSSLVFTMWGTIR